MNWETKIHRLTYKWADYVGKTRELREEWKDADEVDAHSFRVR